MAFTSSYDPAAYSFKKKIISRIIASVHYYLKYGDINRAESGLITLLNVVGYLSSEILEVHTTHVESHCSVLGLLSIFATQLPFKLQCHCGVYKKSETERVTKF